MEPHNMYCITAFCWTDKLVARFGGDDSVHALTDSEVVKAIIEFGPAAVDEEPGFADGGVQFNRRLCFLND